MYEHIIFFCAMSMNINQINQVTDQKRYHTDMDEVTLKIIR